MILPISTTGLIVLCGGNAEPVSDFSTGQPKLDATSNLPLYAAPLILLMSTGPEVIAAKVAGMPNGLTVGGEPEPQPPPTPFDDPHLLLGAIHAAARRSSIEPPAATEDADRLPKDVVWGSQLDVTVITSSPDAETASPDCTGNQEATAARAVANYLAKYVTNTLPGHQNIVSRGSSDPHRRHVQRIRVTCRQLGQDPALAELRTADRIEGFGYQSRPTSRSRSYSTTMGALRAERQRHATTHADTSKRSDEDSGNLKIGIWRYVGGGWHGLGEAGWVESQATQRLDAADHAH